MRRRFALLPVLLGLIFVAALLFWGWTAATLSFSYSDGERAGLLQKFSRLGWFCKTWEGELVMTSMPGAIPEKFYFSVRDENVAKQLSAAIGKRVTLSYAQHKGVPTSCFGLTEYYVERVQVVQ